MKRMRNWRRRSMRTRTHRIWWRWRVVGKKKDLLIHSWFARRLVVLLIHMVWYFRIGWWVGLRLSWGKLWTKIRDIKGLSYRDRIK
jgi:hypothetical protein